MRKYQQLLLIVISCFSVVILLVYKSENNRLKYVLQVVNFFGRNDAAVIMRLENGTKDETFTDYSYPLPVWQRVGDHFHAYSSYWNRNELIVGGDAIALVVGKRGAIISFKCALFYSKGKMITGKFKFFRIDEDNQTSEFSTYKFLCKLVRDFGIPERLVLTETNTKYSYELLLRHVKPIQTTSRSIPATICMNLAHFNSSSSFVTKTNLLQFFFYHHTIGINHFLVYNGDAIPYNIRKLLRKTSISINYFPFNFPFVSKSDIPRIRQIIEADCLMRNTNGARYTFLLAENEFVYPNAKVDTGDSLMQALGRYESDITRFELTTYAVCLDEKNKLLMDNALYDPESKPIYKLYVYKSTATHLSQSQKTINVPLSLAFAHRYIECTRVGQDGLHDWRNSLRKDFMQYLQLVRNEINFLF